jgi:hypothetical protein
MRDTTVPEERIRAAMKDYQAAIDITLKSGNLDRATIAAHLSLVRARYTLGEGRDACLAPAATVADLYCDWINRRQRTLQWLMDPETGNEFMGAVYLVGKAERLFAAFQGARWDAPPPPWQLVVFNLVCRAFGGQGPEPNAIPDPLPRLPPPLPAAVPMLQAMIDDDGDRFESSSVQFLSKSWGPAAEKGAQAALRSKWPLYTGKWSLLAAASCRRMKRTPELPDKVQPYFPGELV